jgi:hypothetical protein
MGMKRSAVIAARRRADPIREIAAAASVPTHNVIRVATVATINELVSADRKSGELNTSRYQRVESPWNGNESDAVEWNEKRTTTTRGA